MRPIDQELARNEVIRGQIEDARERRGYPASERNDLLMAYFDIILEHHEAIGVLIKNNLLGSGFALLRPAAETLFRALWVNACATPAEIRQVIADDTFKFPMDMIDRIDSAYSKEGFFRFFKRASWASMCSYAHSGHLPFTRRFGADGSVGPNYSEAESIEALRAVTVLTLLTAILFFRTVACDKEASDMETIAVSYSMLPQATPS